MTEIVSSLCVLNAVKDDRSGRTRNESGIFLEEGLCFPGDSSILHISLSASFILFLVILMREECTNSSSYRRYICITSIFLFLIYLELKLIRFQITATL